MRSNRYGRAVVAAGIAASAFASFAGGPAGAAVVSATGDVEVLAAPPPDVSLEKLTSDHHAFVFAERAGATLGADLPVDGREAGAVYTDTTAQPGTIAAGSRVDSHYVHFDRTGTANAARVAGSVTFGRPVLGVIFLADTLNASDEAVGAPGTLYGTNTTARGYEAATDTVAISADGLTVSFTAAVGPWQDELRIVTAAPYDFSGFFPPVENAPAVNAVRAGSAVPVKFSLGGYQGLDVIAAGYPKVVTAACTPTSSVSVLETEAVTAGGSGLAYDAAADQYVYVWKTDEAAGGCATFVLGLDDGTTHTASFSFR